MEKGIAFFDLDGTITSSDTFTDFIVFCRGKFFFLLGLLVLSPLIILYLLKLYPNYRLKELFFSYYLAKYYSIKELDNLGKSYSINRLPSIVYKDALMRIDWHKEKNHTVIILTASSSVWLSEWCKLHKLELIGTQFEKKNEKYTGKILGKNCHGTEKQKIVENILKNNPEYLTFGYGDSKSDRLFLDKLKYRYFRPHWIQILLPLRAIIISLRALQQQ